MPNCSPHSLHETISVFGRWATSLWLSFTATGHRFSPGLNVFLYSSGISSINLPESWYSRNLAEAKSCDVGLSSCGKPRFPVGGNAVYQDLALDTIQPRVAQ